MKRESEEVQVGGENESTEALGETPRKKLKDGGGDAITMQAPVPEEEPPVAEVDPSVVQMEAAIARMDPAEAAIASCDICQIGFSGPESARQHYAGKKHRKQALGLQMGVQSGRAYDFDGSKGRCYICCLAFTSQNDADQHLQGKKHKLQEDRLRIRNKRCGEVPSAQEKTMDTSITNQTDSSSNPTKTADLAPPGGEIEKESESSKDDDTSGPTELVEEYAYDEDTKTGYCYLCNLALTSYNMYNQHINGKAHKRKRLRREASKKETKPSEESDVAAVTEGEGEEAQKPELPDVIQREQAKEKEPEELEQPITVIETRQAKIEPISPDEDDDI